MRRGATTPKRLPSPGALSACRRTIKAAQDAGDEGAALQAARRAVKRFPESARANFELAFHLYKLGRVEECLPYLRKAMEADPRYEEPFFFHGDLLVRQGNNDEAVRYLEKALEIRPDYTAARVSLARAHLSAGRPRDAVAALDEAARLDPSNPQPHLLLS
ncbi:MAG: hypothetical protein DMG07_25190, partial [Acidobacteria bacterium]